MTKPTAPYTYKPPPPAEVEVDAKVAASETIRAVRVILGRSQSPEPGDAAPHPLQTGPEPERGPVTPMSSSTDP